MPRGKKANGAKREEMPKGKYAAAAEGEVDWGGFINVTIDADTKANYELWLEGDGVRFWVLLEDALGDGLKYGLTYDLENTCFIATLTGCAVLGDAKRYCLPARSGHFEDATALLVYKHLILAAGDWGNYKPRTRSFQNWG